jgi:hypothetical protein
MRHLANLIPFLILGALTSCGGTVIPPNPLMQMRASLNANTAYTVLLLDMNLEGTQYQHQYRVLEISASNKVKSTLTDWNKVSDDFFALHQDDLGMELMSKNKDGKTNNLVTPPGFTNFIGNVKYGSWSGPDSLSVWKFDSDQQQLEADLGLKDLAVSKAEYSDFLKRFLFNRPFYGAKVHKDSTKYGTHSRHWLYLRPNFYRRRTSSKNFYKPNTRTTSSSTRGGGGHGK